MIILLWKDGFGEIKQYRCPEYGWTFPSVEAAEKAAKQLVNGGALTAEVWQKPDDPDEPTMQPEGTLLRQFERNAKGKATQRR